MTAPHALPDWREVLVVVAHPDDESFGLGAVIDALVSRGAQVAVLCFTHGEASTLHGSPGDLATLRESELVAAAAALGCSATILRDHPDGALGEVPAAVLVDDVVAVARDRRSEALLVFDPSGVTGHPDHAAAGRAAVAAAQVVGVPVLAWTLPVEVAARLNSDYSAAFSGHRPEEVDVVLEVDRTRQLVAVRAHASQAVPSSVLWRRLELLGRFEHLRWVGPTD